MTYDFTDTIVALATAPGRGARAVVRVAGPDVVAVLQPCFLADDGRQLRAVRQASLVPGRLQLGELHRALPCELLLWPDARSYTRSSLAEIHLIGSAPLAEAAIRRLCQGGCRLAGPGEFTLRAFLGGRLDLTQAEAVLGVIQAADGPQLDVALRQLAGGLSGPLAHLRDHLLELLAHLEASLDFVDEDIQFLSDEDLRRQLQAATEQVAGIAAQMQRRGEVVHQSRVVLTGTTNVGKSSLFNALMEKQGALVSHLAGTTRDYLTATLDLDGITCRLTDTAGIEQFDKTAAASIAAQAQLATDEQLRLADVELLCLDLSRPQPPVRTPRGDSQVRAKRVVALTKRDLLPRSPQPFDAADSTTPVVAVSSHTGEGLDELRQVLRAVVLDLQRSDEVYVPATVTRCREGLRRAAGDLRAALDAADARAGQEIVAAEIRQALDELGQVVGAVYTEDILDRIFSRFCIGK
ncbi:MAG: GTP-binding protein [Planctomycetales bacterium]|nr:GTP-binding protein [Planctomycetales bacterium]NIM10276.1 GTP-binding protein [Planctomycetales bacterium]NIN09714.1 GTP-binding protein [Planctomycetales bacterium]NIN78834.1 GTP-binding protein [Planctomycetales bacterium]NIO36005.1 GTP-binding protein [Planctomycetales bacterium]